MKKFFLIWAVLALAVPAMAVVNVTATQVGTTNEVDITVSWSGEGSLPRAFALDITVDNGTITKVTNYHTGESRGPGDRGYGIFPASFAREIDADDPNWADVNYTPVADVNDLVSGTQPGIGTEGITIEMGSLYVDDNSPPNPAMLCTITVSDDCNVCFALNVGRGGIVMEDGNPPSSDNMPCTKVTIEPVGCDCPGDVSSPAAAGVPDSFVSDADIIYINTKLVDWINAGNRKREIPSSDPQYDLCADVSSPAAAGVPDGFVSDADIIYINTQLVDWINAGNRKREIPCP